MAIASVILFTLMARKNAVVPSLFIVFAAMDLAFHTLGYVATSTTLFSLDPAMLETEQPRILAELKMSIFFWVIFLPYFLVSERVRNTFTHD